MYGDGRVHANHEHDVIIHGARPRRGIVIVIVVSGPETAEEDRERDEFTTFRPRYCE